jgi:hypothetical protein
MTRAVDAKKAADYLTKAENSLHMAKIAVREEAYDNAVMECDTWHHKCSGCSYCFISGKTRIWCSYRRSVLA